jgi:site-specific DNA recombinase
MLEVARAREIDVVYFWKLDRMMRDEYFFYHNEKELRDHGVELRFATQNLDDPFTRAIQVAVAAEERRRILERTKRGLRAAAKAGKWVSGTPAYGYDTDKESRKLKINPEEARWVKKFFEWLVYEQCSLREIARRANSLKVPTKNGRMNTKRKYAKAWWVRTLGRILTNEIYTGVAYFGKYRLHHKDLRTWLDSGRLTPQDQWIEIPVPAIISRELFEAGIRQLKRNSETAARNTKQSYLYSKLIYCSRCGFRLRGSFSHPTSPTSVGSRHYKGTLEKRSAIASKRCQYCGVIAESRLLPVWETLKLVLTDPDYVYARLQEYLDQGKAETARLADRLKEIQAELEHAATQRERIKFAYFEAQSLDDKEYKARIVSSETRTERLVAEKARLARIDPTPVERQERTKAVQDLYARLRQRLVDPSYGTKSAIVHLLVDRIEVDFDQGVAKVDFNFPGIETPTLDVFLGRQNTVGQTPHRSPSKDVVLAGHSLGGMSHKEAPSEAFPLTELRKSFTLALKIPLITTEEWRAASAAGLRGIGKRSHVLEADAMTQLAIEKARALFL